MRIGFGGDGRGGKSGSRETIEMVKNVEAQTWMAVTEVLKRGQSRAIF